MNANAVVVNPNTHTFIEHVLKPLSNRINAGEKPDIAGQELLEEIYPWVLRQITRSTRQLPAGADPAEIASRMLEAAYRRCLVYDPACPQSWPTSLKKSLRGAWLEAYRAVDILSRRHRHLHNLYRYEVSQQEGQLGRSLSQAERTLIAQQVAPSSRHTDWVDILLNYSPPPPITIDSFSGDDSNPILITEAFDPSALACADDLIDSIQQWLDQLPLHLCTALTTAMDTGHSVPPKVRRELSPYIHSLRFIDKELWRKAANLAWS